MWRVTSNGVILENQLVGMHVHNIYVCAVCSQALLDCFFYIWVDEKGLVKLKAE